MAVKTIATQELVTSSSFSGVDTNIYPSNGTAGVANFDNYSFTANNGLAFGNSAACILGKPTVVDGTALSADTFDTTNSPYMWNGTQYVANPNSIIQVTDGEYNIEERVSVRWAVITQNSNLFNGNDTCRPVFYGVDWYIDGPNHTNWIGNSNAYTAAAPIFIDNTISMLGQTGFAFRLRGDKYIIDGLTWTSMATTGAPAMEFATPPLVAPRGLVIAHPRLTDLGARTALAFLNNGTADATGDPENRFVFEGLDAPNFPVYFGGSNAFASPGRGAAMINSLGSPVPFDSATTSPDATTSGTNVNIQLNSRDIPHVLGGGQLGQFQRVNINFDAPGYTLRIRRTGVESYTHGDFDASVFYKGGTKTSNGGLNRVASNFDSTTSTLGAAANSSTQSEPDGTIGWDFVTDAAFAGTFRGEGFDAEVAGTEMSVVLPAYMQLQIAASGLGGRTFPTLFFGWEIYAVHEERGITQVETLSFLPDTFDTRYGNGQDIEINFSTDADALYTSDRDISSAGAITDSAYLHDAVKDYQVERNSATAYDASHLNSEIQVATSTGTLTDFTNLDVTLDDTTGNRVVQAQQLDTFNFDAGTSATADVEFTLTQPVVSGATVTFTSVENATITVSGQTVTFSYDDDVIAGSFTAAYDTNEVKTNTLVRLKPASTGIINTVDGDGVIQQRATGFTTTGNVDVDSTALTYFTLEGGAITNLGSGSNSSFTGTSLALSSASTYRSSTFSGAITDALSTSFVDGTNATNNIFDDGSIAFTGLGATATLNSLLGVGWSFVNAGGVTLTSATSVTISVNEADLEALGITLAEGASTAEANGVTYFHTPQVFVNQVVIPEAGRIHVERVSDKVDVIGVPAGTTVTQNQAFDIQYGVGSTLKEADVVRVYFQPTDTALQPTVYDTTVSSLTINTTSRPTALYATSTYTTVPGMSTNAGRMIVSFANDITNGPDTQRAFLLAATTSAYFTLLYTQNTDKSSAGATLEFDFINGGANGSTEIKGDQVRLTSDLQDDAIADLEQRTIVNAVDLDSASDFILNFDNVDFATVVIEVQGNLSEAATRILLQEEITPVAADVAQIETNTETLSSNQQGLETAIRRGALKAAAYSSTDVTVIT